MSYFADALFISIRVECEEIDALFKKRRDGCETISREVDKCCLSISRKYGYETDFGTLLLFYEIDVESRLAVCPLDLKSGTLLEGLS